MYEFVCAKFIGIITVASGCGAGFSVGPKVGSARPFVRRTEAVAPIVAVRKTTARVTDNRSFYFAHFFDEFFANAVDIWHLRIRANPDSVVEHAAQVFGEVSVQIGRNDSQVLVRENFDAGVGTRVGPGKGRGSFCCENKPGAGQTFVQKFAASDHDDLEGQNTVNIVNVCNGRRYEILLMFFEFITLSASSKWRLFASKSIEYNRDVPRVLLIMDWAPRRSSERKRFLIWYFFRN